MRGKPPRPLNLRVRPSFGIRTRPVIGIEIAATFFRNDYENQIVAAWIAGGTAFTNGGETVSVVANFLTPVSGSSFGYINLNDRNLLRELRSNPENFYITVSNAEFPDGAVRGQLSSNY